MEKVFVPVFEEINQYIVFLIPLQILSNQHLTSNFYNSLFWVRFAIIDVHFSLEIVFDEFLMREAGLGLVDWLGLRDIIKSEKNEHEKKMFQFF